MDREQEDRSVESLSPLELHIVDLLHGLASAIGLLCGTEEEDDDAFPLAEFDQRILLEHVQVIERYVLAQAAARLAPGQFRLIGKAITRSPSSPAEHEHEHEHEYDQHDASGHSHEHGEIAHEHHIADPAQARDAHRQGRAIIGEHPWEQGHGDDGGHADEWASEPFGGQS